MIELAFTMLEGDTFSIVGAFYNSQIIDHFSFPHTMLLRKYGKKNKCKL